MRASASCTMQQSLTPEAAGTVKQAINLARRRGHAQVTPIHVASIMLATPGGLLQRACLKSHSHPLQHKALELCFNVALNRLPTTSPTPLLSQYQQQQYQYPHQNPSSQQLPSISNALVAAFKRAQAHQRRGSVENQQQPILALKIEAEQLVISILDDPSVSRVMREAGFSSTHVKANVEQAVSLEVNSPVQRSTTSPLTPLSFSQPLLPFGQLLEPALISSSKVRSEDVSAMIQALMGKGSTTTKKNNNNNNNTVVVGECVTNCEGVVRAVKDRIESGDVPAQLKFAHFLTLPLLSIKSFSKDEIDMKLGEVRCLLKGCLGRGVVLYLGDLRWVSDYWRACYGDQQQQQQRTNFYCPVEHMIMGLRRMALGNNTNTNSNNTQEENNGPTSRFTLLAVANFNSYLKCKAGHPSLETLLDLHPLTIPYGSLDFSLNLESSSQEDKKSITASDENSGCPNQRGSQKMSLTLTCCTSCSSKFHQEAQTTIPTPSIWNFESPTTTTTTTTTTSTTSSLPSWLQKCKEESHTNTTITTNQKDQAQIKELCKKWNSICSTIHNTPNCSSGSLSPSPTTSISSYGQNNHHLKLLHENKQSWPIMFGHQRLTSDHNYDPPKPDLLSNPNSTPNSTSSSSEGPETITPPGFTEFTPDNLHAMCSALEKRVPRHTDIVQDIAIAVLKCRSGMITRSNTNKQVEKRETWLSFLGVDVQGKVKIGRELARLVFGSRTCFHSIGLSTSFSHSDDSSRNKRPRQESAGHCFLESFARAVRDDPHRVFYVEDIEQVDRYSLKGIKEATETGRIVLRNGDQVALQDAIIIFSTESFSSTSRACSPPIRHKTQHDNNDNDHHHHHHVDVDGEEEATSACVQLDLNLTAHDDDSDYSIGDIGILDSVDSQIFFQIHVL